MGVAYFAHELSDPAVEKRVAMLAAGGCDVTLLGFERGRFATPTDTRRQILGRTHSGKLAARILSVLLAFPRALRVRDSWNGADAFIARNLEMLALARVLMPFARRRPRLIYECLDIHRLMLSHGMAGSVMRWIERRCLARVDLILTSSPAFEHQYFRARQRYQGDTLVLENKVFALNGAAMATPAITRPAAPWKIAWCGVLRCKRSFDILAELAAREGERVEIELWGVPALEEIPDFHARVAANPRFAFMGRYRPENLASIYAGAHFVWTVDYYEAGGNSEWLLPNRLYEGLRFGAVPIAAAGVETARWLEARRVGVVLDAPLAQTLPAFLRSLTHERFAILSADVAALAPDATSFSAADCAGIARRVVAA